MRHDVSLDGDSYRIRPVEEKDAAFMVHLRTDPELTRFLNRLSPRVEDQQAYIEAYFERPGDYYFIVERLHDRRREGMIALYDVDGDKRTGEWGRWILRRDSMAAVESVLLVADFAFERLDLDMIYCRTVLANEKVVSFQDSCGFERQAILPNYVDVDGRLFDSIEHRLTRERWPVIRAPLAEKASLVARMLRRD